MVKKRKKTTRTSADKAATEAAPGSAQPAITKKAALEYLRGIEVQLYARKTEKAVAKLGFSEKMDFFRERAAFSALILALNAQLMRDIGENLQAEARSLKQGMDNISTSLKKLEGAAQWAKAINTTVTSIGKVVKLFT